MAPSEAPITEAEENSPAAIEFRMEMEKEQQEAAQADTVGQFKTRFETGMRSVLDRTEPAGDGAALEDGQEGALAAARAQFERRLRAIEQATSGTEDMQLDDLDDNVLGQNRIGSGTKGVLNRELVSGMHEGNADGTVKYTKEHEGRHGDQVQLRGDLFDETGAAIHHLLLYEGDAEVHAHGEMGGGRRKGQPAEVYGEGQDLVQHIAGKVGRAVVDEVMTKTGDVSQLQKAFTPHDIRDEAKEDETSFSLSA